jgi:hypothetical protein
MACQPPSPPTSLSPPPLSRYHLWPSSDAASPPHIDPHGGAGRVVAAKRHRGSRASAGRDCDCGGERRGRLVGLRNASAKPCCTWVPSTVSSPASPAQTAACIRLALRPPRRDTMPTFPDLPRPSSTFPDLPRPSPTFPDLPRPPRPQVEGRRKPIGSRTVEEGRRRSKKVEGRGRSKEAQVGTRRGEGGERARRLRAAAEAALPPITGRRNDAMSANPPNMACQVGSTPIVATSPHVSTVPD